ncbi:ORC1 [Candida pseudojiufengensis]|uniref:ORC1 n=1 Tax=Candida pseudojiufengensis TaxID=497109 RepID=UPI002225707A|nr:ORC1 [Candida pseudojiufengensis]KAI5961249.1 ORC1 [Candida pseudojiufengensis]
MKTSIKDQWEIIDSVQETPDSSNQQSPRRSGRRTQRTKTKSTDSIKLRRKDDKLEIQVGDAISIQSKGVVNYGLVKQIKYDIDELEVTVAWFCTKNEIRNQPIDALENEIFITPYSDEINLNEIQDHVKIKSSNDEAGEGFICQRATNESDKLSDTFDYNELLDKLKLSSIIFTDHVKKLLFNPSSLKQETKQKNVEPIENHKDSPEDPNEESEDSAKPESSDDDSMSENEEPAISTPRKRKSPTKSSPAKLSPAKFLPSKRSKISPHNSQIQNMYSLLSPNRKIQISQSNNSIPLFTSPTKPKNIPEILDPTSEAIKEIKAKLHTSQKLTALPGREDEFSMIYASLESAVNEGTGCCIYISGVPGMGKTATVKDVIFQMNELVKEKQLNEFNFIEINGLKLLSPTVAYSKLWEYISGDKVSDSNAAVLLEEYYKIEDENRKPLVVLMDEIDQIASKKQNVMYNFFNWPTYSTSKLIVIAVGNTMDLPERLLSNKISSRMGLRRIQFKGYTFQQLGIIIQHRLDMLTKNSKHKVEISNDAIGFASRKVASVSGDARRALTICRRAVEIAEKQFLEHATNGENQVYQVTISHISQAVNESINSSLAEYLAGLPYAGKLLLAALLKRIRRTGLAENAVGEVIDEMKNSILMSTTSNPFLTDHTMYDLLYTNGEGKVYIRILNFEFILKSLVEADVISLSNFSTERRRIITLNVSEDEVVSVLKRDKEISQFL